MATGSRGSGGEKAASFCSAGANFAVVRRETSSGRCRVIWRRSSDTKSVNVISVDICRDAQALHLGKKVNKGQSIERTVKKIRSGITRHVMWVVFFLGGGGGSMGLGEIRVSGKILLADVIERPVEEAAPSGVEWRRSRDPYAL